MKLLCLAGPLLCILSIVRGSSLPCILQDLGHGNKICVCNSTYCDTIERVPQIPAGQYVVFISSQQGERFFKMQLPFSNMSYLTSSHASHSFNVNTSMRYQPIMGFGGAVTDSSVFNFVEIWTKTQNQILKSYFSKHGIEYNLCRVPIGGTDFSDHAYTYDDGPEDPELKNFKLADEDIKYKIPFIKRAQKMSSRTINLIASSWSPPIWMKNRQTFSGVSVLKEEHYDTFTRYLLRFIEEYKKRGLDIWALSTGNEPSNGLNPFGKINSLGWLPWKAASWIANSLGPQLQSSIYNNTKLLAFEDQRLFLPWWIEWMTKHNKDILQYIDGFSVHWYWDYLIGDKVIRDVYKKYPDKFIMYTEASMGDKPWQKDVVLGSWTRGERYLKSILENLNNGVVGWMDWNLMLDQKGGPTYIGNYIDSPIIVNPYDNQFYKQPMFYALGHVSKFIEPGAVRVEISPSDKSGVVATAVQNTDGRIVIVLLNKNSKQEDLAINIPEKGWINIEIPAKSFITILS